MTVTQNRGQSLNGPLVASDGHEHHDRMYNVDFDTHQLSPSFLWFLGSSAIRTPWEVRTFTGTKIFGRGAIPSPFYAGSSSFCVWAHHGVQCFVDGARNLHAAIYERLGWRKVRLILDGFHLEEKCKVELSLALKGRTIRNAVLDDLTPLLWLGRLDDAIARLRAIPVGEIKTWTPWTS